MGKASAWCSRLTEYSSRWCAVFFDGTLYASVLCFYNSACKNSGPKEMVLIRAGGINEPRVAPWYFLFKFCT